MADELYDRGEDAGRIKDVGAAQELAGLEATKGKNAALAREKELMGGLTEVQQENLRAVEGLLGKYPHAFVPDKSGAMVRSSEKHGPYLVTRFTARYLTGVISQDGVVFIADAEKHGTSPGIDDEKAAMFDLTRVFDAENGWREKPKISFGDKGEWKTDRLLNVEVMIGPNSVRDSAEKLRPILEKANSEHKDGQPLVVGKKDILEII